MGRKNTKFGISTTLRNMLITDSVVAGLVGDKVYPCVAPEGTDDDYVIYYRDEYGIDSSKMGIYAQKATVMIIAISNDYDKSQEIAEAIFNAISGVHTADENGDLAITLKDSTEDYIDKKYFQFLLFDVV